MDIVSLRKPRTVELDSVTRSTQEQAIKTGGTLMIIQQIFAAVKAMNPDASEEFYYAILRAHEFDVPLHKIAEVKRTGRYGTLVDALRVDM